MNKKYTLETIKKAAIYGDLDTVCALLETRNSCLPIPASWYKAILFEQKKISVEQAGIILHSLFYVVKHDENGNLTLRITQLLRRWRKGSLNRYSIMYTMRWLDFFFENVSTNGIDNLISSIRNPKDVEDFFDLFDRSGPFFRKRIIESALRKDTYLSRKILRETVIKHSENIGTVCAVLKDKKAFSIQAIKETLGGVNGHSEELFRILFSGGFTKFDDYHPQKHYPKSFMNKLILAYYYCVGPDYKYVLNRKKWIDRLINEKDNHLKLAGCLACSRTRFGTPFRIYNELWKIKTMDHRLVHEEDLEPYFTKLSPALLDLVKLSFKSYGYETLHNAVRLLLENYCIEERYVSNSVIREAIIMLDNKEDVGYVYGYSARKEFYKIAFKLLEIECHLECPVLYRKDSRDNIIIVKPIFKRLFADGNDGVSDLFLYVNEAEVIDIHGITYGSRIAIFNTSDKNGDCSGYNVYEIGDIIQGAGYKNGEIFYCSEALARQDPFKGLEEKRGFTALIIK